MICLWKGNTVSLLYDMFLTLQSFILPRALQLAPHRERFSEVQKKTPCRVRGNFSLLRFFQPALPSLPCNRDASLTIQKGIFLREEISGNVVEIRRKSDRVMAIV